MKAVLGSDKVKLPNNQEHIQSCFRCYQEIIMDKEQQQMADNVLKNALANADHALHVLVQLIMAGRDQPMDDWRWIGDMVWWTVWYDMITISCEDLFLIAEHKVSYDDYCERYRYTENKINLKTFIMSRKDG